MSKRIVLTGGGSAGHVVLNLALIPSLLEAGWEIAYLGSEKGIERQMLADFPQVGYQAISTGKLRRKLVWANIKANCADVGHVLQGMGQARRFLKEFDPQIVFSKGGFVSVPVVTAAHRLGIPILSHESDLTPGLANRITAPMVKKILTTFQETKNYIKQPRKAYYLGPVLRDSIRHGDRDQGLRRFGFSGERPVLLVLGGSLGAQGLNQLVWDQLDPFLESFDLLHMVGQGKGEEQSDSPHYRQVDFLKEEMGDALAMADFILSRAGSNAIFEFLYYRKPMLLVPYVRGSRGDQLENASLFEKKGYAQVFDAETEAAEDFYPAFQKAYAASKEMVQAQESFQFPDGLAEILRLLERYRKK